MTTITTRYYTKGAFLVTGKIGRIPEEATPPTNAMAAECPRRPPSLPPMLDMHCYASAAAGPMLASP